MRSKSIFLSGLMACLLVSCAAPPLRQSASRAKTDTANVQASPGPQSKPSPSSQPILGEPQASASAKAEASATPATLLLPLRLGLALPASLVGQMAQARLVGSQAQGALVAPEGSSLVALQDGRILSNHAAGLISNHGGGLVSNHGGGLISDQGGGLVSNHGGGLISDHGGGYRLAQAQAEGQASGVVKVPATGGGPTYLWLVLALLDQQDQLLQTFAGSGPRMGVWQRFGAEGAKILPPPDSAANFAMAIAHMDEALRQQQYAAIFSQEANGPRLRMLWLPQANSPLSEGRPIMDYQASGSGSSLRTRFVPPLEEAFGLAESAGRFDFSQGPLGTVMDATIGERYLPYEQQSLVGKAINGPLGHSANLRRVRLEAQSLTRSVAFVSRGMLLPGNPPLQQRDLYAFGFSSPGQADAGLAYLRRKALGEVGKMGPFFWVAPDGAELDGNATAPVHFVLANGDRVASSSALAGLIPSLPTPPERDVPEAMAPGHDPTQDLNLRIPPLPAALLLQP